MMLFKIAFKNIRRSIKDYAIYFFTLVIGIACFYVFNAMDSQAAILEMNDSSRQAVKLMVTVMENLSIFISIVLGFLIIYASRYLMKRRNREFGTYLILGMSKRSVSAILSIETLFIGVISLGVGLGVGIAASQGISLIIANMFEADMTKFAFVFSESSFIKTLIYFVIIYAVVILFNVISVNVKKIIDLINSNKKSEKVKLKNPILCITVFGISVAALIYAYMMVTVNFQSLVFTEIWIPLTILCVSTFFIFWSASGLLLRLCQSFKGFYYRGINSFVVRQVSSKINTNIFVMTIICIMLFLTMTILTSGLTVINSINKDMDKLTPVDVQIMKESFTDDGNYISDSTENNNVTESDNAKENTSIEDTLKSYGFDTDKYLKDVVEYNIYAFNDVTFNTTNDDPNYRDYYLREEVMSISDYNKVAEAFGNETYTLGDNEYIIAANYDMVTNIRNKSLESGKTIILGNNVLKPKYANCVDGFVKISESKANFGIIIVPDNVVKYADSSSEYLTANYNANDKAGKNAVEKMIYDLYKSNRGELINGNSAFSINSKIRIHSSAVGLNDIILFVGVYIGIIFLITGSAILSIKELSETSDNRERYAILRKLGVSKRELNKGLFSQMISFFMLPLILGVIHSIVGLMFIDNILQMATLNSVLNFASLFGAIAFILAIYGGYFVITYFSCRNMIKEK